MAKLTFVSDEVNGDWAGFYIDGKLVDQGHSINVWEVLEALDIDYKRLPIYMDTYKFCQLPDNFSDIPKERLEGPVPGDEGY